MGLYNGSLANYYGGLETLGGYQFISITDVINNFRIAYVGEDKIISKISRADIKFHALRGLQELTYDTFRSCKTLELEVPPSLLLPLPHDYVDYVKLSWVDSAGKCHTINQCKACPKDPVSYVQNDDGGIDVGELVETTTTEYIIGEGGEVDIVIAVDSSNSVASNDNVSNMTNFISDFITGLATELASGQTRIALVHFGAGRNSEGPMASGGNPSGSDQMFELGQQQKLTSSTTELTAWLNDIYTVEASGGGQDVPAGTSIIGGIWCGLNLLYGDNSRNVSKKLITIIDGAHSSFGGTLATTLTSPADVYDNMTVFPVTPDATGVAPDVLTGDDKTNVPAAFGWDNVPTGIDDWVQTNVVNNAQYTDLETFAVLVNPYNKNPNGADPSTDVTLSWRNYTDKLAHPNNGHYGSFDLPGDTDVIVADIVAAIAPSIETINTVTSNYTTDPVVEDSTTWSNISGSASGSGSGEDNYASGNARYGLDPQYANINGCFWINCRTGKIHYDSNLAGKTVTIQYISDGVATDGEMMVHKFAEEAMYKHIAHAILNTRANVDRNLVATYKKERFAAVRNAKIRLSSIKLEEITQIIRGKSKWIKH